MWYFRLAKQTAAILYTFPNECCWDQHCHRQKKHFSFTTAYVFSSPFHGSESCLKREGECGWSYNFFMVHFALLSSPKSLPKARLNSDITIQTHMHATYQNTCACRSVQTDLSCNVCTCYSLLAVFQRLLMLICLSDVNAAPLPPDVCGSRVKYLRNYSIICH